MEQTVTENLYVRYSVLSKALICLVLLSYSKVSTLCMNLCEVAPVYIHADLFTYLD